MSTARQIWIGFGLLVLFTAIPGFGQIEFKKIDGVPHVLNPAAPSKGAVRLEVDRSRTINPFDQPEAALKELNFARRSDGAVVLYDPAIPQALLFGAKGEYLGSFVKKGQGPGEFDSMTNGILPAGVPSRVFFNRGVWVTSRTKLAVFDEKGRFLREQIIQFQPSTFVDEGHFLVERTERNPSSNEQTKSISLVKMTEQSRSDIVEVDYLRVAGVGLIQNKNGKGGLVDPWATPNLCHAYDLKTSRVFTALNTDYKITVKDLKGTTLSVIESARENIKIGRKEAAAILGNLVKNEPFKWMLDSYPDHLIAFNDIQSLSNGFLLVRRVSGPKETEIDVFDGEGRYLYALKPPPGLTFDAVTFYDRGFSVVDSKGDFPVYAEYRIKNLPEVFGR